MPPTHICFRRRCPKTRKLSLCSLLFMRSDRLIPGVYCFCPVCLSVCLFVCLSVVNFNLCHNFWTIRDRDFIFSMHTPLIKYFQMTSRSMTLWPWLWHMLKIAFSTVCHNFWSIGDRDFIFGMHTPPIKSFQTTARSMILWPWLWPIC